ncbi:MAG: tRNA pseudouridine(55) synthase TruB, partial [Clostridia bacterium]|nr:tRNA pseudouridine(55) synthase TruB [Clostridia bacterium]
PLATGVLPICIGREATKLSQMIMDGNKGYRAVVQLGATTNTQDAEGEILETRSADGIGEKEIKAVLSRFIGEVTQIPPMYSAIKINGEKLYNLARKGIEVERKPRKIQIFNIELLVCDEQNHTFEIQVDCSKGTYIRTLCADIGEALGCGAYMKELTRNKCGRFSLEQSVTLEEFENLFNEGKAETVLIKPEEVLKEF